MTSFESPLSEEQLRFFSATLRSGLPIFVTVNKHDLVSETEREQALAFVRSHLQDLYGSSPPKVSRSSRQACRKADQGAGLLGASGLPALEDALTRFLLEQKSSVFLARMSTRVGDLLNDIPASDGLTALRQRAQALSEEYRARRLPATPILATNSLRLPLAETSCGHVKYAPPSKPKPGIFLPAISTNSR